MAGLSRVAMGQILGAYVVLLLFGLGVHYGAAQGSPLGVLFMVVSVSSVPFILNGPVNLRSKVQEAISLAHPSKPHAEGTSGGSPRRDTEAARTSRGCTPPRSEKGKRSKRRSHQPKLIDLWHETESLRHVEVLEGVDPPPRTPLVIRDMCAPRPDDALIVPNARAPVQFTNENFRGCALMKFKTYPDDPYYKPYFDGKRRLFEVQVQGRFLRTSENEDLFIGMEVPQAVTLGVVTRALSRVILGVINRLVKGAHYSFGDGKEIPHICFPFQSSIDRLVITEPGQTPPPLGVEMFPETLSKTQRTNLKHDFVPENTYSISIHGMYMDFVRWEVANLPGLRPIDLRLFWGDMPVRLIAYTVPKNYTGPHTEEMRKMLFRFELDNIKEKMPDAEERIDMRQRRRASVHEGEEAVLDAIEDMGHDSQDSDGDEDEMDDDSDRSSLDSTRSTATASSLSALKVARTVPGQMPTLTQLATMVDSTPPVDVSVGLYVVGLRSSSTLWYAIRVMEPTLKTWVVIRPARAFAALSTPSGLQWSAASKGDAFPPPKVLPSNAATHIHERQCRLLTDFLRQYLKAGPDGVLILRWFLQNFDPKIDLLDAKKENFRCQTKGRVLWEGCIALAQWETRWLEAWGVLTAETFCIYTGAHRKPSFTVGTKDILAMSRIPEKPFRGSFLQLETLGRIYYMSTHSDHMREEFSTAALRCLEAQKGTDNPGVLSDPRAHFMFKCGRWGSDRIVMNHRKQLLGRTPATSDDPQLLIQKLLRMVLHPDVWRCTSQSSTRTLEFNNDALIAFLDATSELKRIKISQLTDFTHDEALTFWLNFYHCLLAHALLILGPPTTSRRMLVFFNSVSYEMAGLPFSLGEVEHSILRAPMSQPDVLLKFVLPGRFAKSDPRHQLILREREPRINFGLNWGGVSCGMQVPVFETSTVHAQLNDACARLLAATVVADTSKQQITIPKVCDWYCKDFGSSKMDTLRYILTHLPADKYAQIGVLSEHVSIKYAKHEWDLVPRLTEMTSSGSDHTESGSN